MKKQTSPTAPGARIPVKLHRRVTLVQTEDAVLAEELLAGIELGLELKFGAAGLQLMREISQLTDVEVLRAVRQAIKTAASSNVLRLICSRTLGAPTSDSPNFRRCSSQTSVRAFTNQITLKF